MNQKRMLAGVAAAVLVISTGAASYAAEAQDTTAKLREAVLMTNATEVTAEGEQNLPEGVVYQDAISMDGAEAIAFDSEDLPDGVMVVDEIHGIGGENVTTFNTTDLPEGVEFADAISMDGMHAMKISD